MLRYLVLDVSVPFVGVACATIFLCLLKEVLLWAWIFVLIVRLCILAACG